MLDLWISLDILLLRMVKIMLCPKFSDILTYLSIYYLELDIKLESLNLKYTSC